MDENLIGGISLEDIIAAASTNMDEEIKKKKVIQSVIKKSTECIFGDRYLDLIGGFCGDVMQNFIQEANYYNEKMVEFLEYKNSIEIEKSKVCEKFDTELKELEEIIKRHTLNYSEIVKLFSDNKIDLNKYDEFTEKEYSSVEDLKKLLNALSNSNLILRNSSLKKKKCAKIGKSSLNFIKDAMSKMNDKKIKTENAKNAELQRLENQINEKKLLVDKEIDEHLSRFYDYLRSKDLQELNNHWSEYLLKYQITQLSEYNSTQNVKNSSVFLYNIIYRVTVSDKMLSVIYNAFNKLNFIEILEYDGKMTEFDDFKTIKFAIPYFDVLTDNSNKYFINVPFSSQIQYGIQSYMLRLLSQSELSDYDFVLMDPISNGKSFPDIIGLVHDDGYGITNNIYCDKNEISKALSELSNKIKMINQTLKGYSSIYEYNKDYPNNKINTTIFIAYNFCDEYYREELLSPIFENADKCGITIFAITPFAGSNTTVNTLKVVNSYYHETFEFDENTQKIIRPIFDENSQKTYNAEIEFPGKQLNTVEWIEKYNETLKKGIQICNTYSDINDKLPDFYSLDSTNGLHIPFAVNKKNQIVNFNLAVSMCYHAFVSGQTGIGKSVLLHSLIASVIRNYHPDDVELWLVDYKAVEFYEYVNNRPPHIKLIGLDRSKEFTKSFLDKLYSTMEERKRMIMEAGFQKIEEYKKHFGKNSMPRIMLIIDEAHVLSQHLSEEDNYKQLFENILSEYRAFGLSVILSDQAYKNSMKGITEKGRGQIGVRVAMKNSIEEIQSTIEVDHSYYQDTELKNNINTLSTGDAIFRWNEATDDGSAQLHLDKVKSIFTDRDNDRKSIINKSRDLVENTDYKPKDALLVIGKDRSSIFDKCNPFDNIIKLEDIPKKFEITLGTPSSLEPFHRISVRKRKSANIIFCCSDEDMQLSVSLFSAINFNKLFNSKIYVIAAEDRLSEAIKSYFYSVFGNNVVIAESDIEYDKALDEIKKDQKCFVIWFGIDEILDEMELLKKSPSDNDMFSSTSSNSGALYDIFGNAKVSSKLPENQSGKELHNRSDEIIDLLDKGSAYGKYSLVIIESMREIAVKRSIKMDFFEHKLAFNISSEESMSLFGKSRTIEVEGELKQSTVIYSDGLEYSILRPFKVDEKLKDYFSDN